MELKSVKSAIKKLIEDKKYHLLPIIPFIILFFVFIDNTYYNKKNPIKGYLLAFIVNVLIFLLIYIILGHK